MRFLSSLLVTLLASTSHAWPWGSKKDDTPAEPKQEQNPEWRKKMQSLPDCLHFYMRHPDAPEFDALPALQQEISKKLWEKMENAGPVDTVARDKVLLAMRKDIADLNDAGEYIEDPEPHSILMYREKPEDPSFNQRSDPGFQREFTKRAHQKFVIQIIKTKAHPIQGAGGNASYYLHILVGSCDEGLQFMWDIKPQNVGAVPVSRTEEGFQFTQSIPCGEIEHVLEHVRELIEKGMIPAQELEFQRFYPPSAGETFMGFFWLILVLVGLFCACAGCCCRGVFHYIFCLFLCKKKDDKKSEDGKNKNPALKKIVYPSAIPERKSPRAFPRPNTTTGGASVTGLVPVPMLAVEPLTAPQPEEDMTPIEIRVEGVNDSLMKSTVSVQAVDSTNQNGSASESSEIEIAIHMNDASISAAVRSGSADYIPGSNPESTSNSEIEVAMPETDASISAAVRSASSCHASES